MQHCSVAQQHTDATIPHEGYRASMGAWCVMQGYNVSQQHHHQHHITSISASDAALHSPTTTTITTVPATPTLLLFAQVDVATHAQDIAFITTAFVLHG